MTKTNINIIDSYSFGAMIINNKRYTKDLIVSSQKITSNWWRKQGHLLTFDDLKEALSFKPQVLIIGTGNSRMMKLEKDLILKLEKLGIKTFAQKTQEAYETFNKLLKEDKKVVGAFHLTC